LGFFAPAPYDVGTKDSRSIMDVAVFRLSKKDKRPGDIIRYDMPDGFVQVSTGPAGMASVWDYDIVLMAVSHLTAATNRWRAGKGDTRASSTATESCRPPLRATPMPSRSSCRTGYTARWWRWSGRMS
jgi:hypothetical protein